MVEFYIYCLKNFNLYLLFLVSIILVSMFFLQKQKFKFFNPIYILNLGVFSFMISTSFFLIKYYGEKKELVNILIIHILYLLGIYLNDFIYRKKNKKLIDIEITGEERQVYRLNLVLYIFLVFLNFKKGIPILTASRYNIEYSILERIIIFYSKEVLTIWLILFIIKNYFTKKYYLKTLLLIVANLLLSGLKTSFLIIFFVMFFYLEYYQIKDKKNIYIKLRKKMLFFGILMLSLTSIIYWSKFQMDIIQSLKIRFINSGDALYIFTKEYYKELYEKYNLLGFIRYLFSSLFSLIGFEKVYSIGEYTHLFLENNFNRGGPVDNIHIILIILFSKAKYIIAFIFGVISSKILLRNLKRKDIWYDYKIFYIIKLVCVIVPLSINSIFPDFLTYGIVGYSIYILNKVYILFLRTFFKKKGRESVG